MSCFVLENKAFIYYSTKRICNLQLNTSQNKSIKYIIKKVSMWQWHIQKSFLQNNSMSLLSLGANISDKIQ